jgi:hypothetical protein
MEQKDIIEGNELIARFMGGLRVLVQNGIVRVKSSNPDIVEKWTIAQYDHDWNWLMDVIEKIEAISTTEIPKVYISIQGHSCMIWNYYDPMEVLRTAADQTYRIKKNSHSKVKATWLACVDFIKFYNTTPR